jgi:hypothetical protein
MLIVIHSTPVSQYTLLEGIQGGGAKQYRIWGCVLYAPPSWPCQFYDIFFLIPQKSLFFAEAVYGSPFIPMAALWQCMTSSQESGSRTWVVGKVLGDP